MRTNNDGSVTLYHGTTKKAAKSIVKDLLIRSAGEPNVYLTNLPHYVGYGDGTIVRVDVDPRDLELDDEFPNGRLDYKLPGNVYKVKRASIIGNSFKEWILNNFD